MPSFRISTARCGTRRARVRSRGRRGALSDFLTLCESPAGAAPPAGAGRGRGARGRDGCGLQGDPRAIHHPLHPRSAEPKDRRRIHRRPVFRHLENRWAFREGENGGLHGGFLHHLQSSRAGRSASSWVRCSPGVSQVHGCLRSAATEPTLRSGLSVDAGAICFDQASRRTRVTRFTRRRPGARTAPDRNRPSARAGPQGAVLHDAAALEDRIRSGSAGGEPVGDDEWRCVPASDAPSPPGSGSPDSESRL